jgi:8-oxo-dGTP pyrophosphatase MutT (NUDIX family)
LVITICANYASGINIYSVKEKLRQRLARRRKRRIVSAHRVPAAVLLPLYCEHGKWHLVFIKRTEKVKEHKGQISFPGGNRDAADRTMLDTALRESAEEIGLRAGDAEVLGELDDELTTTSNYIVSPFVAAIPWPYSFQANEAEVGEIIQIPISALLDRGCLQRHRESVDGKMVESYNYYYQGRIIWGATARILHGFLEIFTRALQDKVPTDETGGNESEK